MKIQPSSYRLFDSLGFNYITNYVLADTLSVASAADHIKKGNLFLAFKRLGDATGFMFTSRNGDDQASAIAGNFVQVHDVKTLHAVSPPGLIRDGKLIEVSPGRCI